MSGKRLYLIPGRGEKLGDTLGQIIMKMGYVIKCRELLSSFERLFFPEQIELVRSDLQAFYWTFDAVLLGRSYGAYLLLHTLADMDPFPGKVLLFSPVIGAAIARDRLYMSFPPRAKKLLMLADSDRFPTPGYMEIHTGAEDMGCDPLLAKQFVSRLENVKLIVVPEAGHEFSENYMVSAIHRFVGAP